MNYGPYPAILRDWHDGDTGHFDIDLGFASFLLSHDFDGKPILAARIYGINAPELSNPDGSGIAARDYAYTICPTGTRVTLLSHSWDKYGGRYDATITLPDGTDFAKHMLDTGHAVSL